MLEHAPLPPSAQPTQDEAGQGVTGEPQPAQIKPSSGPRSPRQQATAEVHGPATRSQEPSPLKKGKKSGGGVAAVVAPWGQVFRVRGR